jgi:light-regulated signal transduction histidine kinase (bacteriophytochrome)
MVLEFTPSKRVAGAAAWAHKELLHDPVTSEHGDQLARERLLKAVQKGTGADRVLFYRFCADGDGEVVTETVSAEEEGRYLGLRFPASDIPQIARNLYRLNPWRLISDARSEPTPLLSGGFAPPDLSRSDLRSVSPVHRVYMGNMGVVGSLSFPVVVRDSLVALVTAHSRVVLLPQLETLEQLSAQVQAYNLAYTAFQAQHRMRMVDNLARRFEPVLWTLRRYGDVHAAWPELAPDLMTEFGADGAVVVSSQGCTVAGQGVEPAALVALDSWFESGTEVVWLGDNLVRQVPHFPHSETAGAIALRVVNRAAQAYRVYLTRRQHVHEVSWGGNPHKPVDYHDGVLGIKPRLSFEKWVEKRMGYALAWRNEDRLLGFKLRDLMQQAGTL